MGFGVVPIINEELKVSAKKTVSLIVGWAIIGVVAFVFLQAAKHPRLGRIRTAFKDKAAIISDNLLDSVAASRRPPLTTIELEENLKRNLSVPFASFNQDDWEWFWHLLYGKFTEESGEWPRRKKQLTKQEIQSMLAEYYYRPFSSFREKQWEIFWQHILKGRVFK